VRLDQPIDAVDRWLESIIGDSDAVRGVPQHDDMLEWLETHDYTEANDQPDDPEEMQFARDTMEFFLEDGHHPSDPTFAFDFRAFIHINDYSYSAATIQHLLDSVLHK
jgi:hypothetical protein